MFNDKPRAFTLIEALVVIAIVVVLAAIAVPVVSAAKRKARRSECQEHLRRLGLAFHLYASIYDRRFPHEDAGSGGSPPQGACWFDLLDPHLNAGGANRVKQCPAFDGDRKWHSYKMNSLLEADDDHFYRLGSSPDESRTVLLFDGRTDNAGNRTQTKGTHRSAERRHEDGTNLLFVDGGVCFHQPEWNPKGGWADAGPFLWSWGP